MRTAKFSNLCCWLVVPALEKPLLEQRRREIHGIIKPITPLVVDTADSCSSMDDIATFVNAQRLLKIIVVVFIITWSRLHSMCHNALSCEKPAFLFSFVINFARILNIIRALTVPTWI